jgi:hypothetical protein
LDVIKLTAQFVARNGKSFLTGLTSREHMNPQARGALQLRAPRREADAAHAHARRSSTSSSRPTACSLFSLHLRTHIPKC